MAIKKSTYTGGMGRPTLHSPNIAFAATEAIIEHVFNEAVAATDILEIAYLPAYCRIMSAEVFSIGTGAVTFNVGFMSGKVGDVDPARTSGAEIFSAVTPTAKAEAAINTVAGLAMSDADRSIGIVPSAQVAANAGTKIYLRLRYAKIGR